MKCVFDIISEASDESIFLYKPSCQLTSSSPKSMRTTKAVHNVIHQSLDCRHYQHPSSNLYFRTQPVLTFVSVELCEEL